MDCESAARRDVVGRAKGAALLRDIVGNPFRPVTLPYGPCVNCREPMKTRVKGPHVAGPCPWLTPMVLSLAQAAVDKRLADRTLDPLRLAILADALEEAGAPMMERCPECDDESEYRIYCRYCEGSGCAGQIRNPLLAHLRGWRRNVERVGQGPAGRKSDWIDRGWVKDEAAQTHVRGCWAIDLLLGKE